MRRLSARDAALQRLQAWAFWLAFGAVVAALWIALPVEAGTELKAPDASRPADPAGSQFDARSPSPLEHHDNDHPVPEGVFRSRPHSR